MLKDTCKNCNQEILKEKTRDPFFHVESGQERCDNGSTFAQPPVADGAKLRRVVLKFLGEYGLVGKDADTHVYSQAEWKVRGERYCNDSPFVLTFEGALYRVMNPGYGDERDARIEAEFNDLVRAYGWYWEMGYAWCAGFYRCA